MNLSTHLLSGKVHLTRRDNDGSIRIVAIFNSYRDAWLAIWNLFYVK